MKFLLFTLYIFAIWSFGAFGLDAVATTASVNAYLNDLKHAEYDNSEKEENQIQTKSMIRLDDIENDGYLIYGHEVLDDNRLLPNFNVKRVSRINVFPRGCVPRNGACDNRPNDCCFNSSCRCNLWGSNCRCQRVGLFQKWG